jgi:hypothetical protein
MHTLTLSSELISLSVNLATDIYPRTGISWFRVRSNDSTYKDYSELSGSVKRWEFPDELGEYLILKKIPTAQR